MDKLVIRGGQALRGTLRVSGSKNTALPLMAAALLTDGPVDLGRIPDLKDILTFSKVLEKTGTRVTLDAAAQTLRIDASSLDRFEAPYELVKRMRASFYMLGGLLGRGGRARVSLPGGCAWGPRPVDLHIKGMQALGAEVHLEQGYVIAATPGGRVQGGSFTLEPSSVGATINFLLAAVKAKGGSKLENAAIEPDVVVFCNMLTRMGARIEGVGTRTLEIEGVDQLHPVAFDNCPDRIELGTFMIAAAIAGVPGHEVAILDADVEHLGSAFMDAFARTGAVCRIHDSSICVTAPEKLNPVSVETDIYPGFPTDLQAQWSLLLALSEQGGSIVETVYHDRFKHIPELQRMGMRAEVIDNTVHIQGGARLQGTQVMSTDLRASVSLVLAGLVAEGVTEVLRVYHLDRGYQNLEIKLAGAGIDIKRVQYDEWAEPV